MKKVFYDHKKTEKLNNLRIEWLKLYETLKLETDQSVMESLQAKMDAVSKLVQEESFNVYGSAGAVPLTLTNKPKTL